MRRDVFMPGSALGASTEGILHSYCSNRSCASASLMAAEGSRREAFGDRPSHGAESVEGRFRPLSFSWLISPCVSKKCLGGSFSTTLLDTLQYLRDSRRKTFMICPIWRELGARFVRAAKAIEEHDESLPGGSERNQQLNAAAQELGRHEHEHGCKPNRDDVAADRLRRWEEPRRRIRTRKSRSDW